jgi:membrane protease YdiL (CAAX protease family)
MTTNTAVKSSASLIAPVNIKRIGGVLVVRTALFVLAYFITAGLFTLAGNPDGYTAARPWWPVAGLFVNTVCLALLAGVTKSEHFSLASLIGFDRQKLKKDLLSSLWMIGVSMILAVTATFGFGLPFYGLKTPAGLLSLAALPGWAMVVSLTIFPLVNAFVEEMTYNGYVFPRLAGHISSPWAVAWVTLFFCLQHIAIPFAFDPKFLLWRFLSFVPLLLFWVLIYSRFRRLTPLIVTHWFMDIFALLTILFVPTG